MCLGLSFVSWYKGNDEHNWNPKQNRKPNKIKNQQEKVHTEKKSKQ